MRGNYIIPKNILIIPNFFFGRKTWYNKDNQKEVKSMKKLLSIILILTFTLPVLSTLAPRT